MALVHLVGAAAIDAGARKSCMHNRVVLALGRAWVRAVEVVAWVLLGCIGVEALAKIGFTGKNGGGLCGVTVAATHACGARGVHIFAAVAAIEITVSVVVLVVA